jgi:CDP-4-dehydro-6-deoxyglucose reductase
MRDGALLRIELPIGQFAYRHDDAPLILVAGGTGFAPIKSIMRHVFEKGPARDAHFFWGARTRADLYQDTWLREFQRAHPQLRYTPVLSDDAAADGYEQGWVHAAVLRHYPDLGKHVIYAAGPPQMIEAMRVAFPVAGLAADRLRFDSFDYAPAATSAV